MTSLAEIERLMDKAATASWQPVVSESDAIAIWQRTMIGTTARVALWPPGASDTALRAIDLVIDELDRQVSRFRSDSELSLAQSNAGRPTLLSEGAAEALAVGLAAARITGGAVDPTVGSALEALGYDRDFSAIDPFRQPRRSRPVPGWQSVRLAGRSLLLEPGCRLDLGATAKGLGADRAAVAVRSTGKAEGVLVSIGGDVAAAGRPPVSGWPVAVLEDPAESPLPNTPVVRLVHGGLATSSVLHRRWQQGDTWFHHIVDPRTGLPAQGPWRTATVAARSCAEANVASTAAIVLGPEAEPWLSAHELPARLVGQDGKVRVLGRWPTSPNGALPFPLRSIFEQGHSGRAA